LSEDDPRNPDHEFDPFREIWDQREKERLSVDVSTTPKISGSRMMFRMKMILYLSLLLIFPVRLVQIVSQNGDHPSTPEHSAVPCFSLAQKTLVWRYGMGKWSRTRRQSLRILL
jgi:hypothetical protein